MNFAKAGGQNGLQSLIYPVELHRPSLPGTMTDDTPVLLRRIADALERLAPPPAARADFSAAPAFIWLAETQSFQPVTQVARMPLELLKAVDRMRDTLLKNTRAFAAGLPANNALLWGSRGMGKSSIVKAVHAEVATESESVGRAPLKLVEIHREDIASLPQCLFHLRDREERFILFCDDLSFDAGDASYKSLKAVLDGGIEGRPENVVFYATSNRRHLLARDMVDNERATAINPGEAVEEKVSLSDRFGLWIGFHNCSQADYLDMVNAYAAHFGLDIPPERLRAEALEWAVTRGSRSGRVAWQFTQDLAGRLGKQLPRD